MTNSRITQALGLLDKLSERDRGAVLAALIAVIFGLDMVGAMPLRDQRTAVEKAILVTRDAAQQAQIDAATQQQTSAAGLQQRRVKVTKDLATFGLNNTLKDSLTFLLSRTLQGQDVTIQSLKALDVEQVALEIPAAPEASTPEQAVAANNALPPTLYRHRYELELQAALKDLPSTLNALEHDSRPLRVERIQLRALPSGAMGLTVMLVTIGLDKTWLAL
ncbi:MAG: hypothetical protein V4532_15180 [Pseudomonadota bacterium]